MKILILFLCISFCYSSDTNDTQIPTINKGNGIFTVEWNGVCPINNIKYPIITRLWVEGTLLIPNVGDGATLQMTSRSVLGNAYNPTQGGDCAGNPSLLTGNIPNWSMGLGISPNNGVLLGVQPRNFNGASACLAGPLMDVNFNWGVTLGDGVNFPAQAMILDMGLQRTPGCQVLLKRDSELPSAYPYSSILHYAYYSPDGINYGQITDGQTNDILGWPAGPVYGIDVAKVIYLSTSGNIDEGWGLAFITNNPVHVEAANRPTPYGNLAAMTMTGSTGLNPGNDSIDDYNWHLKRTVVAVGNIATIKDITAIAFAKIPNWGDI